MNRISVFLSILLMQAMLSQSVLAQVNFDQQQTTIAGLDHPDRIPGRYIVILDDEEIDDEMSRRKMGELREQVVEATIDNIAWSTDGKVHKTYDDAFTGFAMTVKEDQAMRSLQSDSRVSMILADITIRSDAVQSNADWGLDRVDQSLLPLNTTYQYQHTGAGVNAYVVDSGINTSHPDFSGRIGVVRDFYRDDNGPGVGANADAFGHGTHVAGILGSNTYGVAKGVTLHSLKVLDNFGEGNLSSVLSALQWLAKNASRPAVANFSIGTHDLPPQHNVAFLDAISSVNLAGVIMVGAAGNDTRNACAHYPSRYGFVIGVGSTDSNDRRSGFSNYGNCVALFAPGSNILSTYRPGAATFTMSGTSMASPFVAGAAALYLQANPNATQNQVASALINSATDDVLTNLAGSPNRLLNTSTLMGLADPQPPQDPIDPNARPRSGLWHDFDNPGSGVHISKNANNDYALYWYTYTNNGTPIWYMADPGPMTGGVWNRTLYKVRWNISQAAPLVQVAGNIRLEMTDNESMRFKWNLGSGSAFDGTIEMDHYQGLGGVTGNWYEPQYNGWGVSASYHNSPQGPDTVALAFVYDGSEPVWTIGTMEGAPTTAISRIDMSYVTSPTDCPGCSGTGTPVYQDAGEIGLLLYGTTQGRGWSDLTFPSNRIWKRGRSNNMIFLTRLTGY